MKNFIVLFCFLITSCALLSKGSPREGKIPYAYVDVSGRFGYSRENKLIKNKIVVRTQIASNQGSAVKPLEKSVTVTQLGSVKEGNKRVLVTRPMASEFSVWLEGKRYHSRMKLDPKSKSMVVDMESPEAKWKGRTKVPVPAGKQFCFFSQIPECLYHNLYLTRTLDRPGTVLNFYIVWDGFPYLQEQFSGISQRLFAPATLKYEGVVKRTLRYAIEVDGQTLLYHFSKSFDLVRMFWIAQGISIVPPNEEIGDGVD